MPFQSDVREQKKHVFAKNRYNFPASKYVTIAGLLEIEPASEVDGCVHAARIRIFYPMYANAGRLLDKKQEEMAIRVRVKLNEAIGKDFAQREDGISFTPRGDVLTSTVVKDVLRTLVELGGVESDEALKAARALGVRYTELNRGLLDSKIEKTLVRKKSGFYSLAADPETLAKLKVDLEEYRSGVPEGPGISVKTVRGHLEVRNPGSELRTVLDRASRKQQGHGL